MKNTHLVIAVAGAMALSALPVETYAQLLAGTSVFGEGMVYAYQGGTNWTAISPSLGYAVLDIIQFNGTLYAATESASASAPGGVGKVWRFEGGTSWTVVGDNMDNAVCALEIYNGQLYAGTSANGGNLYRYNGTNFVYVGTVAYFAGIRAMYSSSYGYLQLGETYNDMFGHYDGTNFYFDADFDFSCVVDFAEYNNKLYAGTEDCAILFGSTDGINWSVVLDCYGAYALWELEPFQGQLYLGYDTGQLAYMDSSNVWHSVLTVSDSIISMVADGDSMLYFGTGIETVGSLEDITGSGPGYVYAYTGNGATNATLISGPLGTSVQCLYYPADSLLITPVGGFTDTGCVGAPFTVTNETFSLTNIGTNSLNWSLANTSTWLDASLGGGTLTAGGSTNVTVSLDSNAYSLTSGIYTATVWFTNLSDNVVQFRQFSLTLGSVPVITAEPTNQTVMAGGTATFSVAVSGTGPFTYQWQLNGTNLPNGIITTVAGGGNDGLGDGGAATNASLNYPFGVAVDASDNLFIADRDNSVIRKVDTSGIITTVAGNYSLRGMYGGDGGSATNASLYSPSGVAVDASGNLFIADAWTARIREVDPYGIITTVAGGTRGYSGDGGPATIASLYSPSGVAVDASGNLFIADTDNNVIRKVDTNGIITTVAGNYGTWGYSGDGGPATNASLELPDGVAVDASDNLFIADTDNHCIRKVDPNGIITTVAGNGTWGYSGDGGPATNASLYGPSGVVVDASGNLVIADTDNNRIREVMWFASYPTLTLCNVTTNNAGNYTVIITSPYGSVTSSIVTLTVVAPIVSQPQSLIVTNGSPASFSVSVFDTLPLSFQWQKDGTNLTNGGNISGSATTNLVLTNVSTNDAGNYTVVITCRYGSVTSSVASLAVVLPPVVLPPEPANQMVMAGGTATFSVAVSGTGPFTYQWQLNGTNLPNGIITTVAGGGNDGLGDGGAATNASLGDPNGVAVDASGNLFIADTDNYVIRKVDTNGIIMTVAGGGTNYLVGYNGPATNASLYYPSGVAMDASGNMFIADTYNCVIRKVDTSAIITTVAGNGNLDYSGDGGAATNASLNYLFGVAVDASGNLFIADTDNSRIRKVNPNGIITTVAGNGTWGYSGDSGAATNASLASPAGVTVDASGNLFIADTDNNRIRKVDPNGIITTVAGKGSSSYSGDGGAVTNASLCYPFGVAVDASGNLFIADTDNSRIREVLLFASYPTLTLCNVTPNIAGNYTVIITSPYGSVTSSVATLAVVSSPIISKVICNTEGSVTLNLLTTPNISSRVLATTNLAPPVVWQPICTNVAGANGVWQFTDRNASNYPVRFYRSSTP